MKWCKTVFVLTMAALAPCSAAVVYQLTGTTQSGAVSFEETLPGFILGNTTILAADLDACTAPVGDACSEVQFQPVSIHDAGFAHLEFFTTSAPPTLFFFDLGSLAAAGVYNTVFGAGTGTLTVTETAVVPEPGTWTLMLGAVAGLLAMKRFRQ